MILSVSAAVPHSQTKDALEPFLKLPKLAGNVQRHGPYLRRGSGDKLYILTLYEFDSSLEVEAEQYIHRRYKCFQNIEGLTLEVHKWHAGKEAINVLGVTPPPVA